MRNLSVQDICLAAGIVLAIVTLVINWLGMDMASIMAAGLSAIALVIAGR